MKKILTTAVLMALMAFAGVAFAADSADTSVDKPVTIGYVDINRLVEEHPANLEWNREFTRLRTERENEVKEKIQEKFGVTELSEVTDPELMENIKKFYMLENDKFLQDVKEGMLPEQNKVLQKVEDDIITYSVIVADQKGLDYILDRAAVVVGGMDVTDDVLSLIKNKKKEEK